MCAQLNLCITWSSICSLSHRNSSLSLALGDRKVPLRVCRCLALHGSAVTKSTRPNSCPSTTTVALRENFVSHLLVRSRRLMWHVMVFFSLEAAPLTTASPHVADDGGPNGADLVGIEVTLTGESDAHMD